MGFQNKSDTITYNKKQKREVTKIHNHKGKQKRTAKNNIHSVHRQTTKEWSPLMAEMPHTHQCGHQRAPAAAKGLLQTGQTSYYCQV